jgi:hypothetical protein
VTALASAAVVVVTAVYTYVDSGTDLDGRSPLVHVRLSNHRAMRMECPLIAAALQTSEVVWVKTRPR